MISRFANFLPKTYLPLLLALCLAFGWKPLRGTDDFWAHAAIGRWMVEHGRIADHTLFLWGPGTPVPWIYHSWLSQVIFFKCLDGVDTQTGALRALVLTCAVALAIVWGLWLMWVRRAAPGALTPFIFAMVIWHFYPRIHPRPELFSSLFLLILMVFLVVWTERRDAPPGEQLPSRLPLRVAGLVALFVLWANVHGGVATGLVFIALTIAGEGVQDLWEKRSLRPTLLLCGILLLCALAININPYGVHYWESLGEVRSKKFSYITEWQNIFQEPAMPDDEIFTSAMLALLALGAWANSPRKRIAHLFWQLFAVASYVLARRQIAQMAEISLVVMAANAGALDSSRFWTLLRRPRRAAPEPANSIAAVDPEDGLPLQPPPLLRLAARLSVVLCLLAMIPSATTRFLWPMRGVEPNIPEPAARYILANCPRARLLSDYTTSSYLNWRLAGKPPLYIDLINAYPDQLMVDYFEIAAASPRGRQLLFKEGVTHVLINAHVREGKSARLYKYLNASRQWKAAYAGPDATIWVRADLANRDFTK